MKDSLLAGMRVIDIAGEPLAMTGRILADMGAEVIKLEPPGGDPLRSAPPLAPDGVSLRFLAFNAGKSCRDYSATDPEIQKLLQAADAVITTPGFPGALNLSPELAPRAVWLLATPFGLNGPRAGWRASDLGLLAACGNLYATGYADEPPLRCAEPAAYAHAAAEAAFAVITALASGRPQHIDLSMAEALMIASMGFAGQYPRTGHKGTRQGAHLGGTREIWRCADGYVSFGLRGGPARADNFRILLAELEREGLASAAWRERDWARFNPGTLTAAQLRAMEAPLAAYFARHSLQELYALAVASNLMLAPVQAASDILASEQLNARGMFATAQGVQKFPARFYLRSDAPEIADTIAAARPARDSESAGNRAAWAGLRILEFGSGAAGPIATRYFSEHGAQVIRVESTTRPDFLRQMAAGSEHGLEGSTLFDALNPGKQSITLNLKHPGGKAIALRLVTWADAVVENFAPKAMRNWGLDYAQLVQHKPDLVMLSSCLNGQSGPQRDYPGFGGQGAALSGYNFLTGLPGREPVGPFGTITDSLSPRFAATALGAALLHRRRTGRGSHIDLSQVETGVYALAPWLLSESVLGVSCTRMGNRSTRAVPHGVFPCAGEDRWIAIVCCNDDEWRRLAQRAGIGGEQFTTLAERQAAVQEIETALGNWTREQNAQAVAESLQKDGMEAVPVANFQELFERDDQLRAREHFVPLSRAVTGESFYERNGFRLSDAPSAIHLPAPLLGEHTGAILREILGCSEEEIAALSASGALE